MFEEKKLVEPSVLEHRKLAKFFKSQSQLLRYCAGAILQRFETCPYESKHLFWVSDKQVVPY